MVFWSKYDDRAVKNWAEMISNDSLAMPNVLWNWAIYWFNGGVVEQRMNQMLEYFPIEKIVRCLRDFKRSKTGDLPEEQVRTIECYEKYFLPIIEKRKP
jgi:hypothetical protein